MKMTKFSIRLLSLSFTLLAVIALLGSCINESDKFSSDCIVPVTISMIIDETSGSTGHRTRAGVYDDTNYNESSEAGSANERYVGTLRVLVFEQATGTLRFNKLFSRTAANPADRFDFDVMQSTLTANFTLFPGTYDFRVVTNENAAWNLQTALTVGTSTKTNYETLTSTQQLTNAITTETGLATQVSTNKVGIPMLGAQTFTIDANAIQNIPNPVILSTIVLKRVLSKVEVYLTNQDPASNPLAVYPTASSYQIKSVAIKKINQNYHLMEGLTTPAVTESDPLQEISQTITHTRGAAFPLARVLHAYMAERVNVPDSAASTYVEIVVNKTGEGDITYNIPIYKMDNGAENYRIFRNHLYRLNCYLNGSDMPYVEIYYSDTDWDLVTRELFMGYGYNVEIDGNNVTISNTIKACAPHKITLKAINGANFGTTTDTEKTFGSINEDTPANPNPQFAATASQNYTLSNVPTSGSYLEVYYNDKLVKTFTK